MPQKNLCQFFRFYAKRTDFYCHFVRIKYDENKLSLSDRKAKWRAIGYRQQNKKQMHKVYKTMVFNEKESKKAKTKEIRMKIPKKRHEKHTKKKISTII